MYSDHQSCITLSSASVPIIMCEGFAHGACKARLGGKNPQIPLVAGCAMN